MPFRGSWVVQGNELKLKAAEQSVNPAAGASEIHSPK
jgi:hypothetical protein